MLEMAPNIKTSWTQFNQATTKIGDLTLAGWISQRVTFTEDEVYSFGEKAADLRSGLISEFSELHKHGGRVLYHFGHLSFQEFLAAGRFARDVNVIKKLRTCVQSVGVGQHTHLFWQFLTGIN